MRVPEHKLSGDPPRALLPAERKFLIFPSERVFIGYIKPAVDPLHGRASFVKALELSTVAGNGKKRARIKIPLHSHHAPILAALAASPVQLICKSVFPCGISGKRVI